MSLAFLTAAFLTTPSTLAILCLLGVASALSLCAAALYDRAPHTGLANIVAGGFYVLCIVLTIASYTQAAYLLTAHLGLR